MSWFDMLMSVTSRGSGELLKEEDWRNIDNWSPRYDEAGATNRKTFIFNDFVENFKVGKTYKVSIEFVDDSDIPINLYYLERMVHDGAWLQTNRVYFTQNQASGILNKEVTFTVTDNDTFYMLWTNRYNNEFESWLNKIAKITITEV